MIDCIRHAAGNEGVFDRVMPGRCFCFFERGPVGTGGKKGSSVFSIEGGYAYITL